MPRGDSTVVVKLTAQNRELVRRVKQSGSELDRLRKQNDTLRRSFDRSQRQAGALSRSLERLGFAGAAGSRQFRAAEGAALAVGAGIGRLAGKLSPVTVGFAALGTAMGGVVAVGADFEAGVSELSAITGAVGDDLAALARSAREMGAATTFSASEATAAFRLVASAQPDLLDSRSALTSVTESALELAEAARIELPAAAQAVGTALNQFGLDAAEADRVVQLLAAGSKFGAASIADTAAALKVAGVSAAASGVGIEEAVAAIQTLAKVGITGAEAGTALRNVLLILEDAGGSLSVETHGLTTALGNLGGEGRSTAQLLELFGRQNVNSARALLENRSALEALTPTLTGTRVATEQAARQTDNLKGDWGRLSSAAAELALVLYEDGGLGDALRATVSGMTAAIEAAAAFARAVIGAAEAVGGAVVAAGRWLGLIERQPAALDATAAALGHVREEAEAAARWHDAYAASAARAATAPAPAALELPDVEALAPAYESLAAAQRDALAASERAIEAARIELDLRGESVAARERALALWDLEAARLAQMRAGMEALYELEDLRTEARAAGDAAAIARIEEQMRLIERRALLANEEYAQARRTIRQIAENREVELGYLAQIAEASRAEQAERERVEGLLQRYRTLRETIRDLEETASAGRTEAHRRHAVELRETLAALERESAAILAAAGAEGEREAQRERHRAAQEAWEERLAALTRRSAAAQDELAAATTRWGDLVRRTSETAVEGFARTLVATRSVRDALGAVVAELVNVAIRIVAVQAAVGLTSALGFDAGPLRGLAAGGFAAPAAPIVVGEAGPEIFVPGVPGSVLPGVSRGMQLTFNFHGGGGRDAREVRAEIARALPMIAAAAARQAKLEVERDAGRPSRIRRALR